MEELHPVVVVLLHLSHSQRLRGSTDVQSLAQISKVCQLGHVLRLFCVQMVADVQITDSFSFEVLWCHCSVIWFDRGWSLNDLPLVVRTHLL